MMNQPPENFFSKTKNFLKHSYDKLAKINDTPHKIAAGFGIGVCLGILPATGPVAAVIVATIFKINKVAALAGSLLTNTWLSVVTFVLAIKIGSVILNLDWQAIHVQIQSIIKDFHWQNLFKASVFNILKPLLIGYVVVGAAAGLLSYASIFSILLLRKKVSHG